MTIIGIAGSDFGFTNDDAVLLRKMGLLLTSSNIEQCSVHLPHWKQGYGAYWYYGDWYMEN